MYLKVNNGMKNSKPPHKTYKKPFSKGKDFRKAPPPPRAPVDMIWGLHAVKEAWVNPNRVIKAAYATEKTVQQLATRVESAKKEGIKRPKFQILERKDFEKRLKLADDLVHQGIAVQVETLPETFLDEVLARLEQEEKACLLLLDQVTDPHNVGAIMRSASAFGAKAVIMQTRHAPNHLNGVLAKIACGAVEHLPVIMETNLSRAIETAKERGFHAYAFDERGEDVLGKVPMHSKSLIVMGAEGKGVRPSVKEACEHILRLDTCAPIYSLNVSNAAAVALYEFSRLDN
jgi:23S rRNA (guanosine2251-2'-O)-methyltransferase